MTDERKSIQSPSTSHSTSAEDFSRMYEGRPPWDIDGPQPEFVRVADQITGTILDIGCGTGENAIFFAARGHQVTGVDLLERPLEIARQKVQERNVNVDFIQKNALVIDELDRKFENVIDSGLFHGFSDSDRQIYADTMGKVLVPGGRLYLQCFSDEEPAGEGPRRVSKSEIRAVFSEGWEIRQIVPTRFVVRDDAEVNFSEGGPKSWFCIIERVAESS